MSYIKNSKGITLIALVITIIVLLILASVSILTLFGENGLLERAKWSTFLNEFSIVEESVDIKNMEKQIDDKTTNLVLNIETTEKIQNENLQESLVDTIKNIEKIETITETEVELYKIDLKKLNLDIDNEYIINIKSGTIYKMKGHKYNGKVYHRPDYGSGKQQNTEEDTKLRLEDMSVTIGKTKKIVSYLGNDIINNSEIQWESSDTNILTVDVEGCITGINLGKATLTGKLKNNDKKTATIEIEVTELIQAIYTKEDMEEFRTNVNSGDTYQGLTVRLMRNIDLQGGSSNIWETIGDGNVSFNGVFEGNNNKISGLYIETNNAVQGLFGEIWDSRIQNLKVDGYVKASYYVGGIAGITNNATIDNCEFRGTVIATGKDSASETDAGGITGRMGTLGGTITNCKNYASIEGVNHGISIGGIVGWQMKGNVENCNNYGTVKGVNSVGGIAGDSASNQHLEYEAIINNCNNYGNVIGEQSNIGGIDGYIGGKDTQVTNCNNEAEIICNGKDSNGSSETGGIVGATAKFGENIKIINCKNKGKVSTMGYDTGGIVGDLVKGSVEKCENYGYICNNVGYLAGIVGAGGTAANGDISISKSINFGKVERIDEELVFGPIGGICGQIYGYIDNCINNGEINSEAKDKNDKSYVGGIAGDIHQCGAEITYCYNSGKISSKYNVAGGIVGRSPKRTASIKISPSIEYCYNIGEIKANSIAGGIAGENSDTIDPVSNCLYLENKLSLTGTDSTETVLGKLKDTDGIKEIINLETWKDYFVQDKTTNINFGFPILNWQ